MKELAERQSKLKDVLLWSKRPGFDHKKPKVDFIDPDLDEVIKS